MKKFLQFVVCIFIIASCGSSKRVVHKRPNPYSKTVVKSPDLRNLFSNYSGSNSSRVNEILKDAEKYLGAPYKYGGNTSKGFDCSGLVCKVFDENKMKLPRRSIDQGNQGVEISIRNTKPGDLLFFATSGGRNVSHVGIVHTINSNGEIIFIHSSTSKGVIISSLNEKYWNKAYLFARRIL